jgi:hypothetical protein
MVACRSNDSACTSDVLWNFVTICLDMANYRRVVRQSGDVRGFSALFEHGMRIMVSMTALSVDDSDPDDPVETFRVLPPRFYAVPGRV